MAALSGSRRRGAGGVRGMGGGGFAVIIKHHWFNERGI